ncbi:MAG: redoxin domain-containing protein [Chloroflexia bacterium]
MSRDREELDPSEPPDLALSATESGPAGQALRAAAAQIAPDPDFAVHLEARLVRASQPQQRLYLRPRHRLQPRPDHRPAAEPTGFFGQRRVQFAMSGLAVSLAVLAVFGLSVFLGRNSTSGSSAAVAVAGTPAADTVTSGDDNANRTLGPSVGNIAPDFQLTDVQTNQVVKLSSLRGKPVLLNFWGTWCPPCRAEMPEIQKLYDRMKGEAYFVGVSMGPRDAPEGVKQFVKQSNYGWTFLHDSDYAAATNYQIVGVPSTFFIDKDGVIRSLHVGGADAATLESGLQKAIAQAPAPVAVGTVASNVSGMAPTAEVVPEGEVPPAPVQTVTRPQTSPVTSVSGTLIPATPEPIESAPRMPLDDFKKLYDDPAKRPLIIDVRAKEAYDAGHIEGAISFPESDVDTRIGELPKDKLVVAYCQ